MRDIIKKVKELPLWLKIVVCLFIPFLIPVVIFCHFISALMEMDEKMNAVLVNPTEETVVAAIEHLEKSIISFNNNPNNWNRIRGIWNAANRSNRVTTPTKEKFLEVLMRRGLYVNNARVIDNYGI